MKIAIVGCGYTGRILARRLIERGDPVRATTTSETNLSALAALGAEPSLVRAEDEDTLKKGFEGVEAIVYLAPPPKDEAPADVVRRIRDACPASLKTFVYGSTTGVFGDHAGEWIDESTPPRDPHERGQRRWDTEKALRDAGLPLRVVRIAGIYGPTRTLRAAIQREALLLIDGARPTSRVHVEDLARLLEAMLEPDAPPLAVACDEEPAPTLDVARFTCALLGVEAPEPVSLEDAKRVMSKTAQEMRLHGHRCRSLVREKLIGPLEFPTYREGVEASLRLEGVLSPK